MSGDTTKRGCSQCGERVETGMMNTIRYKGRRIHDACYLKLNFSGRAIQQSESVIRSANQPDTQNR